MNYRDLLLKLMKLEYDLRGACDLNDVLAASEWVTFTNEEVAELGRIKDEAFDAWLTKTYIPTAEEETETERQLQAGLDTLTK